MPGGDRTGPLGMGPMTGRRAGYCVGNDIPEDVNSISDNLRNRGRGFGNGRRHGFKHGFGRGLGWLGAIVAGEVLARRLSGESKNDEKILLTDEINALEKALSEMKKRLSEIERGE